jgi:hypothetical protein
MEIWKKIPSYADYEVSNLGRVRSLKFNRVLILATTNRDGYRSVDLRMKGKKRFTANVHLLVAMAFMNHKRGTKNIHVNHKNFDRSDNRLVNLNLLTHRVNCNQKHLPSSSKYTGVHWDKVNNKFRASIWLNGKHKNLGRYDSEIEAHKAYLSELERNNIKIQ